MKPEIHREPGSESKLDIVFLVANGMLFAVIATGAFVPDLRLWGIDHLSYYPPPVRLAALFLAAMTLLPGVGEWIYERCASLFERVTATPVRRRAFAGIAVLAALGLFIGFQSSTELLGDGQLQSKLLVRTVGNTDATFSYFARTVLGDSMAPGTNLLVYAVAKITGTGDPVAAWRFVNAILGCAFVLLILGIIYKSRAPVEFRFLLGAVLLVSGGIQLFFGYIETYAPMIVLTALYIMAAIENIRGRRHILVPVVLFILAVFFHYQALLLGPSLLFVLLSRMSDGWNSRRFQILATTIGVFTALAAIILSQISGLARFFMPVFGGENTPGILDPAHIADITNEVLLIVPIAPFLIALAVSRAFSNAPGSAATEQRPQVQPPGKTGERDLAFAILIHVPCVIFLFVFFPELGMARDWDLFALPAFGAVIPLLVYTRHALGRPGPRSYMKRFFVAAVTTGLLIAVPWIGINTSEDRSVSRYQTILGLDDTDAGYGYEILAMHFSDRGDFEMKAVAYDKAYAKSGNPRHLVSACSARLRSGEIKRAASTLRTYLDSNPGYDLAREIYIEALVMIGNMPEVIRVCSDGIALRPDRPYFHFYLGVAYHHEGFPDKAKEAFDDCRKLDPPTIMVDAMDEMAGAPGS